MTASYRCSHCGKVCYETERAARRAIARLVRRHHRPVHVYFAETCGWFHLTSTRKQKLRKDRHRKPVSWHR